MSKNKIDETRKTGSRKAARAHADRKANKYGFYGFNYASWEEDEEFDLFGDDEIEESETDEDSVED